MRVLITGANGFVGQHLCKVLSATPHQIVACSRNATKFDDEIVFYSKELSSTADWSDALVNVDVVVHLAGRAHVMSESVENPYLAYKKVNVDGTVNLAQQAIQSRVKRFIYISSVKVNGECSYDKPYSEEDEPKPEDDYGKSKYEAEIALKTLANKSEMEFVIIRPPLIYGPGVKANFLNLIRFCNQSVPLPFGSINNKRSFIYIDNLTSFIKLCLTHEKAANEIFLVSDNDDQSTSNLIKSIKLALNKSEFLLSIPQSILVWVLTMLNKASLAKRLCNNLQVNIEKAQTMLGWKPQITFQEGVYNTVKNFKNGYEKII